MTADRCTKYSKGSILPPLDRVYMYKRQSMVRAVEVQQLTRSWHFDGVHVTVRCFYVLASRPRYELLMTGRDSTGMVDIPVDQEHDLTIQMEAAALCFAAAVRLRWICAS